MAVYPPRMAPFGLKLWGNAFQTIPDVSFFDAENVKKNWGLTIFFSDNKCCRKKCFGVEKSNVGAHLKRVSPKFEAEQSHPQGVKGRSKFCKNCIFYVFGVEK